MMHCMKYPLLSPSLHFMNYDITWRTAYVDAFNLLPCHCRSLGNLNTPPQSHSQSKSVWPEMPGNHGKPNLLLMSELSSSNGLF